MALAYPDRVATQEELPDEDSSNAACGSDNQDLGELRSRDGEFTVGALNEGLFFVLVDGKGPRELAEVQEAPPDVVQELA